MQSKTSSPSHQIQNSPGHATHHPGTLLPEKQLPLDYGSFQEKMQQSVNFNLTNTTKSNQKVDSNF